MATSMMRLGGAGNNAPGDGYSPVFRYRRRMRRWLILGMVAVALLFPWRAAAAEGACARAVERWAAACPGVELSAVACPPGRLVVRVAPSGSPPFDVEVQAAAGRELRSTRGIGFQPVGEFADWSAQPIARRRALDGLVACVENGSLPPVAFASDDGEAPVPKLRQARARPPPAVPWLLLVALGACLVALLFGSRPRARSLLLGVALATATFVARWLLLPVAQFHQNGQAASWIRTALADRHGLSAYGPGYAEVFGWVAALEPQHPATAVHVANAALGAWLPLCGWLLARRAGAGRVLSAGLFVALLVDPLLARTAQSESYFGTITGLGALAAAALAAGAHRAGRLGRSAGSRGRFGQKSRFWLAAGSAGLLVAQAARIHPIGWPALGLVPLVVLVQPGRLRRRVEQTLAAGAVIAALVVLTSGRALADALAGPIGAKWLPATAWPSGLFGAAVGFVVVALVVAWRLPRARVAIPLAVIALAAVLGVAANPVDRDVVWVSEAYPRQFAPLLVAGVAAALARLVRGRAERIAGVALALGACLHAGVRWDALTRLPTDAREAAWFEQHRSDLPEGATVVYLARAGERAFVLPLYPSHDELSRGELPVSAEQPMPELRELPAPVYYYRSSLCSTPEGRARCHAIEQRFELEVVATTSLEPVASQPWHPLGPEPVPVGLFRVAGWL